MCEFTPTITPTNWFCTLILFLYIILIAGFHMTLSIFKLKNYWSSWVFTVTGLSKCTGDRLHRQLLWRFRQLWIVGEKHKNEQLKKLWNRKRNCFNHTLNVLFRDFWRVFESAPVAVIWYHEAKKNSVGLFSLSLNNRSLRMKNERHTKAFECLFFENLSVLTFYFLF